MRQFSSLLTGGAVTSLALLTACNGNVAGNVFAEETGRLSEEPLAREPYDAEIVDACGSGEPTVEGKGHLRRSPFLQQVTDGSAAVVWRDDGTAQVDVVVTTPDGEEVLTVAARTDEDAPGMHQRIARVDALQASTIYCYALHADGTAWTGPAGFRTAPAAGSIEPVRFAVFGDSGYGGADQRAVYDQMQQVPFDLMLHTGDVAYEDGTRGELDAHFFRFYEPTLRLISSFPMSGNHDYRTASGEPFLRSFVLPDNGMSVEERDRWYSFDWGQVHFVALNTEYAAEPQVTWLEADLAANELPWTVVYTHHGPYSSGSHGSNGRFRKHFVPILERHGVDVVFSGHDHHYERSKPIDGITYIVTGAGGRGTRSVGSSVFTAFSHDVLHFIYGHISGERMRLYAIDATGQQFDYTEITRR